ncbi:MAG TPA: CHAP domain-containing protein, partial [Chloroflexi bacterium]|nr:CHAP domain-containing protein [Chloroflexota bacterium]
MRKLFSAIMILVLLTSGVASAARPISTRSTSAHAPAPPTPPAVSAEERSPSTEAGAIEQNFPTPPVPGELAPEMEEARARQAIETVLQKRLDYWGTRYQTAPVEVMVEGEWAYGVAEWESVDQMTDGPIHVLARRDESGSWQALIPSEEGLFPQWMEEMPERLVPDEKRSRLRIQAIEADLSQESYVPPTAIGTSPRDWHHGISTNASDHFLYLDSIPIRLTIPFTITNFTASSSDEIFQMATSVQYDPFLEVRLIALPISSTRLINYVLGIPEGEKYTSYSQALENTRQYQNSVSQESREIYMFGKKMRSISNLISLNINRNTKEPVIIHEWLTQSDERLWVFRISYGQESDFADLRLQDVSISMEIPQTVSHFFDQPIPEQLASSPITSMTPNDLPFPPWWNGDCNVNNFPGSYPLGGIYNGVKACGPLNTAREVNFGAGVPQYEWQCPELSKRYLYLAYGTPPYSAHGKDVVWNYPATDLEKVSNGTPNKAPKAGSILSYGSTDPYGHTSIVSSANIDSNGNGTITVIEQNWSNSGSRTHTVSSWVVQASMAVSGWLYDSGGGACAAPSLIEPANGAVLSNNTITFRWHAVSGCTFNGYT